MDSLRCLRNLFLISITASLGAGADSSTEAAAAAANTDEDPGDHVVDPHELAGCILEEFVVLDELDPLLLIWSVIGVKWGGQDITGSKSTALTESPDHAGNPPGEAAALEAGEDGRAAGDADEHQGTELAAGVDEAPHEPGHEVVVNGVEFSDDS